MAKGSGVRGGAGFYDERRRFARCRAHKMLDESDKKRDGGLRRLLGVV